MKTLALVVRRPDHTRQAFRDHYEDIHAPLAMQTVMEGATRYVRYHVESEIHGSPEFDVVTAFQFRNPQAAAALMERLASEQGKPIIADEATFMDREKNSFFVVEEHPVHGLEDRAAGLSVAVLVRGPADEERKGFLERYESEFLPQLLDATREPAWCLQNRAQPMGRAPLPFDAVTQLHAKGDASLGAWAEALEATGARALVLAVGECETETPWN